MKMITLIILQMVLLAGTSKVFVKGSDLALFAQIMDDKPAELTRSEQQKPIMRKFMHNFDFDAGSYEVKAEESQDLLDWYVVRLKGFISPEFAILRFERSLPDLEKELLDIDYLAEDDARHVGAVLQQLTFANRMLGVMRDSCVKLRKYYKPDSPGHMLVYNAIELNVKVLMLFNSRGAPDASVPKYAEQVRTYLRSVYYWDMHFRGMESVTTEMQAMFEEHIGLAEVTLDMLAKYIPKD